MGFKFTSIRLPFVRVSQRKTRRTAKKPARTVRTFVWHVGPWQYNARTGQHSLKVSKRVTWQSKTKAVKAAEAKAKTARQAAERAHWDAEVARTNGGRTASDRPGRPSAARAGAASPQARPTSPGGGTDTAVQPARGIGLAADREAYNRLSIAERQAKVRAAGLCGARTNDGSPCLNYRNCPHHARPGGRP